MAGDAGGHLEDGVEMEVWEDWAVDDAGDVWSIHCFTWFAGGKVVVVP